MRGKKVVVRRFEFGIKDELEYSAQMQLAGQGQSRPHLRKQVLGI